MNLNSQARDYENQVLIPSKVEAKSVSYRPFDHGMLILTFIFLGLLMIAIWLLRKSNRLQPRSRAPISMKVINNLSLGPRKYLSLVQVAGESILIGISDQGIHYIKTLSLLDEDFQDEVDFKDKLKAQKDPSSKVDSIGLDQVTTGNNKSVDHLAELSELVKDRLRTLPKL